MPGDKTSVFKSPDPIRIAGQISDILLSPVDKQEKIKSLLKFTVELVNAIGAVFYIQQDAKLLTSHQLLSAKEELSDRDILKECKSNSEFALAEDKASIVSLLRIPSVQILSCPVPARSSRPGCCLTVLVSLGKNPHEPFLIILQLMVVTLAGLNDLIETNSTGNEPLSLIELLSAEKQTLNAQSFSLLLREWSNCATLAIGSVGKSGKIRLETISDVVVVDSRTRQSRRFLKVMQECWQQQSPMLWPSKAADGSNHSLLLKELVQRSGGQQGAVVPFLYGSGSTFLVLLWTDKNDRVERINELNSVVPFLSPALHAIFSSGLARNKKIATTGLSEKKRKLLMVLGALLLSAIFFFPVTFNLHPASRVKPLQVRYVTARFNGMLKQVFVEPGDRVERGTPLAALDGREMELELRSLEADSAKALKVRDNYLAMGSVAPAQIALLEARRLQERGRLLYERQQQLELQSPVAGIVLSGDLKKKVDGPVTRGQVLFEVSPLKQLVVELSVLDENISYVAEGMNVVVRFDAFPGRVWSTVVERISPKSELRRGANVFPVTLILENRDRLLQPGMQGRAAIDCGKKNLGWIYFHKPWYALCRLLSSLF